MRKLTYFLEILLISCLFASPVLRAGSLVNLTLNRAPTAENATVKYAAENRWSIEARSNDCSLGIAVGGGWYIPNTQVNLIAIPYEGCVFVKWSDNVTDNPRNVIVNSNDGYYEAIFRKTDQFKSYDFNEDYFDYKPYKGENQDNGSGGGNNGSNGNSGGNKQEEVPHAPFPFIIYGWKVR